MNFLNILSDSKPVESSPEARDMQSAAKLWDISEKLVGFKANCDENLNLVLYPICKINILEYIYAIAIIRIMIMFFIL